MYVCGIMAADLSPLDFSKVDNQPHFFKKS